MRRQKRRSVCGNKTPAVRLSQLRLAVRCVAAEGEACCCCFLLLHPSLLLLEECWDHLLCNALGQQIPPCQAPHANIRPAAHGKGDDEAGRQHGAWSMPGLGAAQCNAEALAKVRAEASKLGVPTRTKAPSWPS